MKIIKLSKFASSWIRTSDVLSERDYESRAFDPSAIDALLSYKYNNLYQELQ